MSILSRSERAKIGLDGFLEKHKTKRCWIFHDWDVWETTSSGKVREGDLYVGFFVQQQRICIRCKRIDIRMTKALS